MRRSCAFSECRWTPAFPAPSAGISRVHFRVPQACTSNVLLRYQERIGVDGSHGGFPQEGLCYRGSCFSIQRSSGPPIKSHSRISSNVSLHRFNALIWLMSISLRRALLCDLSLDRMVSNVVAALCAQAKTRSKSGGSSFLKGSSFGVCP